jgi:flagellar motor switch protein FliG
MSVNAKVNDPHEGLIASLLEMPDQEIKTLLKTIDTTHLAPALKTCPISLQKKVLSNMAKKPAAILTQQILNVRVDEAHRISSSRKNVANAIKRMQLQQEKAT